MQALQLIRYRKGGCLFSRSSTGSQTVITSADRQRFQMEVQEGSNSRCMVRYKGPGRIQMVRAFLQFGWYNGPSHPGSSLVGEVQ